MYREDPASIVIAVLKSVFGDLECIVPYPQKAGKKLMFCKKSVD